MSTKLSSISRKSPGHYAVELEVLGTDQRLIFDFHVVEHRDIDMVQWSEEFSQYLSRNLGASSWLQLLQHLGTCDSASGGGAQIPPRARP
jgi:hypothetical protein